MINWDLYKGSKQERSKRAYEEFCNKIKEIGYELVGDYVKNNIKVKLICDKGHEIEVLPDTIKRGVRCRKCKGQDPEQAKEDFMNLAKEEGYRVIGDYINNKTKIKVICPEHHEYYVSPGAFKRGNRCSKCSGKDPEQAKEDFMNLAKEEGYEIVGDYVNATTKIKMICPTHHVYYITPHSFKCGTRCSICAGKDTKNSKENFIRVAEKEGYKIIGKYINTHTRIKTICPSGHVYFAKPNSFKRGVRCPHCGTISHGEVLTKKILDEYNCKYESQKKFDGLVGLGGGQLSYDFFVDDYLLIEIQGKQHYKPIKLYGGLEQFKQQQEHDRRKREFAKENGYELLEIPYFGIKDLDKLEKVLREKLSKKYLIAS